MLRIPVFLIKRADISAHMIIVFICHGEPDKAEVDKRGFIGSIADCGDYY